MIAKLVIESLRQWAVTPADCVLLETVLAEKADQGRLDACLRVFDIEIQETHKNLLLAWLMRERPDLRFPAAVVPRLNGLLLFYRFRNIGLLRHFSKIGRALNAAGIPLLLFKGAAMKVLRPEFSRPMNDVDALVPRERLSETIALCEKLGFHDSLSGARYAVDLQTRQGEPAVDVHHALFGSWGRHGTFGPAFHAGMLERAREREAFGARVLLPAHEDLFFIALLSLQQNLRLRSSRAGLFFLLADCRFLPSDKADFDWNIVRENARLSGAAAPLRLAAETAASLVPGLLPDLDGRFPRPGSYPSFCNQVLYEEKYLTPRRVAFRPLRVADLKNAPWFYGKALLKLLLLTRLRVFPPFVAWLLRRRARLEASGCLPDSVRNRALYEEKCLGPRRAAFLSLRVAELRNAPRVHGTALLKLCILAGLSIFPPFVAWFLRRRARLEESRAR